MVYIALDLTLYTKKVGNLLNKFIRKIKQEKGFTLVELLAVIAILGIIVAIAVPSIGKVVDNSKEDAHEANVQLFENAARLADVSGLAIPSGQDGYSLSDLEGAGYLNDIPVNPLTDAEYEATLLVKVTVDPNNGTKRFEFQYPENQQ